MIPEIALILEVPYQMALVELKGIANSVTRVIIPRVYTTWLFPIKKKDVSFWMCINYQELHTVIVKKKYPLPRINELFDQVKSVSVFFKD